MTWWVIDWLCTCSIGSSGYHLANPYRPGDDFVPEVLAANGYHLANPYRPGDDFVPVALAVTGTALG